MKRILLACMAAGVVYGGKMPCYSTQAFEKEFYEYSQKYQNRGLARDDFDRIDAEYSGPHWCENCLNGCHRTNIVPLGAATTGIHIGCGYGDTVPKHDVKLVIHQENPCYIVGPNRALATTKKVDDHTVEITAKRKVWCDIEPFNFGRRGLDYLYEPIPKGSRNILGNSLACVEKPNIETWEIYYKENGEWVLKHTEKFIYDKDHPILQKIRSHKR